MGSPRKSQRPNHMTPDERDEAVALYVAGTTQDRLCEIFDRERTTVSRLMKRRGALRRMENAVRTLNNHVDSP